MSYLVHVLIMAEIFTIASVSLDLVAGQLGVLSMAHAAFYGIGAYSSALVCVRMGWNLVAGTLVGVGVAAILSLLVSLPAIRLRGDYLVIVTFGFQVLAFEFFNNMTAFTGGPSGITNIPSLSVLGLRFDSQFAHLCLVSLAAIGVVWFARSIRESAFGRVLRAIREDTKIAESLGKNVVSFQIKTFAISAGLAALGGSFYATYVSYIDPTSFTVAESVLMISMVIIGGAGSAWGAVVGAVLLVSLPEVLRFADLPSGVSANLREIIYGCLLAATMAFRPRGLLGSRDFG
jgi:branched-chain amino acid transport system permease protein